MADTEKKTMSQRFDNLKSEFKKVVWPEPKDAAKQTVAVVATTVVIALIIVVFDYFIQYGVDFLVNL